MKEKILETLKNSTQWVSGRSLSRSLEISRVGVWKHIQGLIASGYEISSSQAGYKLSGSADLLLPWEFPHSGGLIHYKPVVDSTMNWARDMARSGSAGGTIVIGGRQEAGRGRLSRSWDSNEGGLFFTMILRPEISMRYTYLYNFAAAVALTETLREKYDIPAFIKWPNDLLVKDKKVAGILIEISGEPDSIAYLNIGIGINVNNILDASLTRGSSLKSLEGRAFTRKDILTDFQINFFKITKDLNKYMIMNLFKQYTSTIGRSVTVTRKEGMILRGVARDVNEDGALVILKGDGTEELVYFGDCTHL